MFDFERTTVNGREVSRDGKAWVLVEPSPEFEEWRAAAAAEEAAREAERPPPEIDRIAALEAKVAAAEALAEQANVTAQEVAQALRDGTPARPA